MVVSLRKGEEMKKWLDDILVELDQMCQVILIYVFLLLIFGQEILFIDILYCGLVYSIIARVYLKLEREENPKPRAEIILTVTGLVLCLLLGLSMSTKMTMQKVYDKPNFVGIVKEFNGTTLLVGDVTASEPMLSATQVYVPIEAKVKESKSTFKVGDKIKVYYDGTTLETFPERVVTVYAIVDEIASEGEQNTQLN